MWLRKKKEPSIIPKYFDIEEIDGVFIIRLTEKNLLIEDNNKDNSYKKVFLKKIFEIASSSFSKVVINLNKVEYINSSGFSMLIEAAHILRYCNGTPSYGILVLCNTNNAKSKVLSVERLITAFNTAKDEASAIILANK